MLCTSCLELPRQSMHTQRKYLHTPRPLSAAAAMPAAPRLLSIPMHALPSEQSASAVFVQCMERCGRVLESKHWDEAVVLLRQIMGVRCSSALLFTVGCGTLRSCSEEQNVGLI